MENGAALRDWADPTFWVTPDRRIGFSLALFKNINGDKGVMTLRAGTVFADAPNYGALKAALKTALDAVEREEKKIQKPDVPL